MLYITGDMHGVLGRYDDIRSPAGERLLLGAGDYLCVCGDYGFISAPRGTIDFDIQQQRLNEIERLPFTTLFVDGNHENFDAIEQDHPVEEWMGGKVHRLRKNVIHLMRGQVFCIDGVKIFTFGGAYSIDAASQQRKGTWWPRELPSNEEYREAGRNLEAAGNEVDLVLTHTAPRSIIYLMTQGWGDPHDSELTGFLDWVYNDIKFKRWYFGHWHRNEKITDRVHALYEHTVRYDAQEA